MHRWEIWSTCPQGILGEESDECHASIHVPWAEVGPVYNEKPEDGHLPSFPEYNDKFQGKSIALQDLPTQVGRSEEGSCCVAACRRGELIAQPHFLSTQAWALDLFFPVLN